MRKETIILVKIPTTEVKSMYNVEKTCLRYDTPSPNLVSLEKFHPGIHLPMRQYIQHLIFVTGSDFNHCALPFQKDEKKETVTQKEKKL